MLHFAFNAFVRINDLDTREMSNHENTFSMRFLRCVFFSPLLYFAIPCIRHFRMNAKANNEWGNGFWKIYVQKLDVKVMH